MENVCKEDSYINTAWDYETQPEGGFIFPGFSMRGWVICTLEALMVFLPMRIYSYFSLAGQSQFFRGFFSRRESVETVSV